MKRVVASDVVNDFYEFMDDAANFKGWGDPTLVGDLRGVNGLLKDVFHELGAISPGNREYTAQYPELQSEILEIKKLIVTATNKSAKLIEKYEGER